MFQELDLSPVLELPAFAVAVSGGGDSMALVHMLARALPDKTIHAITVDHGLRTNSAQEAASITPWLQGLKNVRHVVLRWEGVKPDSRIMEAARTARYALMADYCHEHGLPVLAVAHHGDDQIETFLMRLSRASGVDGLVGMQVISPYDDGLLLWRPLLGFGHADLIVYCQEHGLQWVEDPSNQNTDYTRVRMRAIGQTLAAEGVNADSIARTTMRLARAKAALEWMVDDLLERAQIEVGKYNLEILRAAPEDIRIRFLRRMIAQIGQGGGYGARYERIESLAKAVFEADVRLRTTLGGCVISVEPRANTLAITLEKTPQN